MLLALAYAAAAAPPPGVDPDDLDTWEARAAGALDGPAGCWRLEGDLRWSYTGYSAPSLFRRAAPGEHRFAGTFSGTLADGRWTAFTYTLKRQSGDGVDLDMSVWPLVGTIDPDLPVRTGPGSEEDGADEKKRKRAKAEVSVEEESDQAVNLLHRAIELIDPATATAYAEWREDRGGLRLIQDVPMTEAARADTLAIATFFPGGGAVPTEVDAVFPRKLHFREGLIGFSIYDAQVHLRSHVVGERVLPAKESVSFGAGVLGFTVGFEQELVYRRATPCGAG